MACCPFQVLCSINGFCVCVVCVWLVLGREGPTHCLCVCFGPSVCFRRFKVRHTITCLKKGARFRQEGVVTYCSLVNAMRSIDQNNVHLQKCPLWGIRGKVASMMMMLHDKGCLPCRHHVSTRHAAIVMPALQCMLSTRLGEIHNSQGRVGRGCIAARRGTREVEW